MNIKLIYILIQYFCQASSNYFCTDLFKVCEQNQRIIILGELSQFLSEDCVDNFATHPIQALIN